MPWNLWGAYASRLDKYTEDLFLLLAWAINYFFAITNARQLKEQLVIQNSDFWDVVFEILEIVNAKCMEWDLDLRAGERGGR